MAAISQYRETMKSILVIGLGLSGYSVVRHLNPGAARLTVSDTRETPPYLSSLRENYPDVEVITGRIPMERIGKYDEIVVSPGVDLPEPINPDILVGDIELFAREAAAPVIGITGSNGKSTVTMLVRDMLRAAGRKVLAGGNIGTPALDLLQEERPDYYVLELSSFQLETVQSLNLVSAAVLNISEDHMDRHQNIGAYTRAKLRIFRNADRAVINRDDSNLCVAFRSPANPVSFGLQSPGNDLDFGVIKDRSVRTLVHGSRKLIREDKLNIRGDQNLSNVLAAMALVHTAGVELDSGVVQAAADFRGLPHRCERIAKSRGVEWINDSKATNTGATMAAIRSMRRPTILIAGGQGKGADFRELGGLIDQHIRHAILIGEDAARIDAALCDKTGRTFAGTLDEAVAIADRQAAQGDVVLFSPACASYDMFDNYEHRGEVFRKLVNERVNR